MEDNVPSIAQRQYCTGAITLVTIFVALELKPKRVLLVCSCLELLKQSVTSLAGLISRNISTP